MSFDPTPETEVKEAPSVFAPVEPLLEPLTREEREEIKALSIKAYGKSSAYQKLLKKGELVPAKATTADGAPIDVKRVEYFTIQKVKERMEKIIADNLEAAANEAAKRKKEAESANKGPGADSVPNPVESTNANSNS